MCEKGRLGGTQGDVQSSFAEKLGSMALPQIQMIEIGQGEVPNQEQRAPDVDS